MERLVTTAQAAEILGISLQGVHYRIRNKKLKSIKQSGKTYVYISDEYEEPALNPTNKTAQKETPTKKKTTQTQEEHAERIVALKDEQIAMMKKSIKWLRAQHKSEIKRLESNQKDIINVFNSEIKLLQSAFNEMRSIYKPMLQQTEEKKPTSNVAKAPQKSQFNTQNERFISVEDFTLYMKKHNKTPKDIKMIILKAVHRKDNRFMYNKKTKKILILNADFSDLL